MSLPTLYGHTPGLVHAELLAHRYYLLEGRLIDLMRTQAEAPTPLFTATQKRLHRVRARGEREFQRAFAAAK